MKAENWERSLSNPDQLGQRVFSCQNTLSALPCLASSRDAPSILFAEATDWLRSAQVTLLDYAREGAHQDQTPGVEDGASNLFPAVDWRLPLPLQPHGTAQSGAAYGRPLTVGPLTSATTFQRPKPTQVNLMQCS